MAYLVFHGRFTGIFLDFLAVVVRSNVHEVPDVVLKKNLVAQMGVREKIAPEARGGDRLASGKGAKIFDIGWRWCRSFLTSFHN